MDFVKCIVNFDVLNLYMNILVISATALEISSLKLFFKSIKNIDVLISGVGAVATGYWLKSALTQKKYDYVIQVGIAGSFDKNIPLGSAVVVSSDSFGDLGVQEKNSFNSVFAMNLINGNKNPFKKNQLINPHKKILKTLQLPMVCGVSVNEISTNKKRIQYYKDELNASVESMEGAAFHYVLILEKIPFIQIRTVSNYVGERNKKNWTIDTAVNKLAFVTTTLINQILQWK